jgi:uncharacterized protein (TIGR03435 family)
MRASAILLFAATALAAAGPRQAPPAKFDAASIKPAAPPNLERMTLGLCTTPGRLTASDMSLKTLILGAYGLKPYQVVGPDWLNNGPRFDVSAETSAPLSRERMIHLLQPFLEQQFQLVTHRETKIMPIYALVLAGATPKLKPASGADAAGGGFSMRGDPQGMRLTGNSDLDQLATMLSRQEDRPVTNQTGLIGVYQIALTFAPTGSGDIDKALRMLRTPTSDAAAAPDAAPPAPALSTALQEQLGLKLVPGKGPVEILVIDSASKLPVGN